MARVVFATAVEFRDRAGRTVIALLERADGHVHVWAAGGEWCFGKDPLSAELHIGRLVDAVAVGSPLPEVRSGVAPRMDAGALAACGLS